MIDWKPPQRALAKAGLYTGAIDGDGGPGTWGALLCYVAGRPAGTATCVLRGRALARQPEWTTPERVSHYVGETSHESSNFTRLRENLVFTHAEVIQQTWPTRFHTVAEAAPFVRQPVLLANRVYARPEEGNVRPGDGWLYRGGGDIQWTFANGYRRLAAALGTDVLGNPDLISDPATAALSGLVFYRLSNLFRLIDLGQFQQARSLSNTGKTTTPRARILGVDDVDARRGRTLALWH